MSEQLTAVTPRPRFALLDLLRFGAAGMVVAYHYLARTSPAWGAEPAHLFPHLSSIAKYGALGVQLFFIISGFVILMTAWERTTESYVASRISRLFPSYWFCVLLTALLLTLVWPGQKVITWSQVLVNLTMTQEAFGVAHVDGVYWTLWAELRFYVIVLLMMRIGLSYRRLLALALLWPTLAAIAHRSGADFIANVLVWQNAPFFAGGIAIFLLHRFGPHPLAYMALALNMALSMPRTSDFLTEMAHNTKLTMSANIGALVVLLSYGLVALVTLTRLRKISLRYLTTAGLLTYPLYLIHEWWGWFIISKLHRHFGAHIALGCAVGFSLVVAWLIVRYVERPIMKPLRLRKR